MPPKIRVYCAVSLDGFLAGEADDLDWLGEPDAQVKGDPGTVDFPSLLEQTGALLLGRRTYDIVRGFEGPWPYGDLPVLVATHRPLQDAPPTVRAVGGDIGTLCGQARAEADKRDVYLDGGGLITQALDADLVDEMILTIVPMLLGRGIALYQGDARHGLFIDRVGTFGPNVQLILSRPRPEAP